MVFTNNTDQYFDTIFNWSVENNLEQFLSQDDRYSIQQQSSSQEEALNKYQEHLKKRYIETEAFQIENPALAAMYFLSTYQNQSFKETVVRLQKVLGFQQSEKLSFHLMDQINNKNNNDQLKAEFQKILEKKQIMPKKDLSEIYQLDKANVAAVNQEDTEKCLKVFDSSPQIGKLQKFLVKENLMQPANVINTCYDDVTQKMLQKFLDNNQIQIPNLALTNNIVENILEGQIKSLMDQVDKQVERIQFQKVEDLKLIERLDQLKIDDLYQTLDLQKFPESCENLGGVDLFIKKFPKVTGLQRDTKRNMINFLSAKNLNKSMNSNEMNVSIIHLAMALQVFYHPTVKSQGISFSLDPSDPTNPNGPYQTQVLYPDLHENKPLVQGTYFSELLFECDYIMQKMSLGYEADGETPFAYPEELVKLGLKPSHQIGENKEKDIFTKEGSHDWSRYWLVCREITGIVQDDMVKFTGVKVGIQARQMIVNSKGGLEDAVVQDFNDRCFKFAAKMESLYDVIQKYYPCFTKLQQLYEASALARWMWLHSIPIDYPLICKIVEKYQRIPNYQSQIRAIKHEEKHVQKRIEKTLIDFDKYIIDAVKQAGWELTPENIKEAEKQIIQKRGGKEIYNEREITESRSWSVFGGVSLICEIQPDPKHAPQTNEPVKEFAKISPNEISFREISNQQVKKSVFTDSTSFQSLSREEFKTPDLKRSDKVVGRINDDFFEKGIENDQEIEFVFLEKQYCHSCSQQLTLAEFQFQNRRENKSGLYFCSMHHERSCFYCHELIGQGVSIQGSKETFDSPLYENQKVLFHEDCCRIFQSQCNEKRHRNHEIRIVQEQEKQIAKYINDLPSSIPRNQILSNNYLDEISGWFCSVCQQKQENRNLCCELCRYYNVDRVNQFVKEAQRQK